MEARSGFDGVDGRQDRQAASYLSAKQAPWVRIPLLPQNLVERKLVEYSFPVIEGSAISFLRTRIW